MEKRELELEESIKSITHKWLNNPFGSMYDLNTEGEVTEKRNVTITKEELNALNRYLKEIEKTKKEIQKELYKLSEAREELKHERELIKWLGDLEEYKHKKEKN